MSQITVRTFDRAVSQYFEPIAREHDWPLIRCSGDVYEVPSPCFVMRIRYGSGLHTKNIDTTLAPVDRSLGDAKGANAELGVLGIAGYNGVEMQILPRQQTEEGFLEYAAYVAGMAKIFGLPYLLGKKSDWDNVREYWRKESERELEKIKNYKYPPSAQKRWRLPPSK